MKVIIGYMHYYWLTLFILPASLIFKQFLPRDAYA